VAKKDEKLRIKPYFFAPFSKMKKLAKNGGKGKTIALPQSSN
jgi:hypothetical protein